MEEQKFTIEDLVPKRKKYFGIKVDKMSVGDYSLGACVSIDSWMGECYMYLNMFKWTVCIGVLTKVVEE